MALAMHTVGSESALAPVDDWEAEVTFGGRTSPRSRAQARVVSLGRRGMMLSSLRVPAGERFAWISFTMPNGQTLSPLVEVGASSEGAVAVRFRHIFPDQQALLDAFHASRATATGY